jgi:hypothetical protein
MSTSFVFTHALITMEYLQWLRQHSFDWGELFMVNAAKYRSLPLIEWAVANGCPIRGYDGASPGLTTLQHDRIDVFNWFAVHDPPDVLVLRNAAAWGQLNITTVCGHETCRASVSCHVTPRFACSALVSGVWRWTRRCSMLRRAPANCTARAGIPYLMHSGVWGTTDTLFLAAQAVTVSSITLWYWRNAVLLIAGRFGVVQFIDVRGCGHNDWRCALDGPQAEIDEVVAAFTLNQALLVEAAAQGRLHFIQWVRGVELELGLGPNERLARVRGGARGISSGRALRRGDVPVGVAPLPQLPAWVHGNHNQYSSYCCTS